MSHRVLRSLDLLAGAPIDFFILYWVMNRLKNVQFTCYIWHTKSGPSTESMTDNIEEVTMLQNGREVTKILNFIVHNFPH